MREKERTSRDLFDEQYRMIKFSMKADNPLALELDAMDRLLDEIPEVLDLVHADLTKGAGQGDGRPSEVTAEQALRSAVLMQLRSLPYRQLADEIDVNPLYRKFTRFYGQDIPHFTTLNKMIKRISPDTMENLNEAVVRLGGKKKVEDGSSVRYDTTVTETDITWPVDARLLNDSVRVLNRNMERLRDLMPALNFEYHNHTRRCKKRAYQIVMSKGKNVEQRRDLNYRDLLKMQEKVRGYAEAAVKEIDNDPAARGNLEVMGIGLELTRAGLLAEQVYAQAYRRVINGEKVPADEKLVSFFETHTDIICRGKKGSKVEFGHKIEFGTGRSGLVVFYNVLEGNPGDNEGLISALDRHIELFGSAPKKVVTDRRYYSEENERMAKGRGVEQVALPKPGYLNRLRKKLQKSLWFKTLLRWRAGIEGTLSTLLRSFGLKRCLWKGFESFKAYVGLSVLTYNLRLIAGHIAQT